MRGRTGTRAVQPGSSMVFGNNNRANPFGTNIVASVAAGTSDYDLAQGSLRA